MKVAIVLALCLFAFALANSDSRYSGLAGLSVAVQDKRKLSCDNLKAIVAEKSRFGMVARFSSKETTETFWANVKELQAEYDSRCKEAPKFSDLFVVKPQPAEAHKNPATPDSKELSCQDLEALIKQRQRFVTVAFFSSMEAHAAYTTKTKTYEVEFESRCKKAQKFSDLFIVKPQAEKTHQNPSTPDSKELSCQDLEALIKQRQHFVTVAFFSSMEAHAAYTTKTKTYEAEFESRCTQRQLAKKECFVSGCARENCAEWTAKMNCPNGMIPSCNEHAICEKIDGKCGFRETIKSRACRLEEQLTGIMKKIL